MNGPDFLHQHTDRLKSRMGACFPGERAVFRGHDLHAELRDMDWVELFVFGITGRRFPPPAVTSAARHVGLYQLPGCPHLEQ